MAWWVVTGLSTSRDSWDKRGHTQPLSDYINRGHSSVDYITSHSYTLLSLRSSSRLVVLLQVSGYYFFGPHGMRRSGAVHTCMGVSAPLGASSTSSSTSWCAPSSVTRPCRLRRAFTLIFACSPSAGATCQMGANHWWVFRRGQGQRVG